MVEMFVFLDKKVILDKYVILDRIKVKVIDFG